MVRPARRRAVPFAFLSRLLASAVTVGLVMIAPPARSQTFTHRWDFVCEPHALVRDQTTRGSCVGDSHTCTTMPFKESCRFFNPRPIDTRSPSAPGRPATEGPGPRSSPMPADIPALLDAVSGFFGRGTPTGEPTLSTPLEPIDPALVKPGLKPLVGGSATNAVDVALVDAVLSTTTAAIVLPFEYEMPRTARPDRDFLKRIAGELRSTGTAHELAFHVGDIDASWLTTEQCVTLDVAFQATFDNGSVRAFPVSLVPVNAVDGTADVRAPVFAGQSGQPTDIRVTSATARACGAAPTPPPVDCTDSFQARDNLQKRATQILQKRDAIYDGISVLQDSLNSTRADQSVTENGLTQGLMYLASAGSIAEAALMLGGVTSPAIEAIHATEDLVTYVLRLKELSQSQAPLTDSLDSLQEAKRSVDTLTDVLQKAATADLEKGTSAAEYVLRGPRPQVMMFNLAILGRLKSAWTTLDRAAERGRAYQAARETLSSVTSRLDAQLAGYREDLASSKKLLDLIHARLSELTAACSTTGAKK
jgi:hypothetical protein